MITTREVTYPADAPTMVGHLARPRFFTDPQELLARALPLLADLPRYVADHDVAVDERTLVAEFDTGTNPFLRRAYDLTGPDEAARLYEEWADTYDRDTAESMGYVGHEVSAARLVELVPAGATVLDAGCGTGLVGVEIARHGEYTLDGLDLSPAMLDKARATGVYRHLATADLTTRLEVDSDAYDALVCVGTLTEGHVGPGALAEFVRVTRPGGVVVATILDAIWEPQGYRATVDGLEADGRATLVEARVRPYRTQQDTTCRLVVLRTR